MAAFAKTRPSPSSASSVPTGPQFDNRRVAAGLIDLAVPLSLGVAAGAAGLSMTLGIQVVMLGWALYYCFALESSGGQTLGKKAMKLRVVSTDGSPATLAQIAKRTVVRIVDWNIIGLIVMVATGERRQRLGDIVAGTVVTDAAATEPAVTGTQAVPHQPETTPAPAPVQDKPKKRRRSLKQLGKIELGRSKKRQEAEVEASAVMAAAPHVAEAIPAEELPESLRPEPTPEMRSVDPLAELPATEPESEPEREPVVEDEPLVAHEPVVEIEDHAAAQHEPVEEDEPFAEPGPEPTVELEPESSPYAHLDAEPSPYAHLSPEPNPFAEQEPSPYAPAESLDEPSAQPEPSPYEHAEVEVEVQPEQSLYEHAEPEADSGPDREPAQQAEPDNHGGRYPETEVADEEVPTVKPIETVSAMDLLMQDVEERQSDSDDPDGQGSGSL